MKKKKEIFKFSGRTHSIRGMISVILGTFSALSLVTLMIISSLSGGNGGSWLGFLGFLLAALAFVGFILGIQACKDKEIYYVAPITGIIVNGFIWVILIVLYLVGSLV